MAIEINLIACKKCCVVIRLGIQQYIDKLGFVFLEGTQSFDTESDKDDVIF